MEREKAINYTSMFRAPISMQLKFFWERKWVILPWRVSLQDIVTFLVSYEVVKFFIFDILNVIGAASGFFLLNYLGTAAGAIGLTYLLINLPLEGKRMDQFLKDHVLYFFRVRIRDVVVYKGNYRKHERQPLIYRAAPLYEEVIS